MITIKSFLIENAGMTFEELTDFSKEFPGGIFENLVIHNGGHSTGAVVLEVLVRYTNGEEKRVLSCITEGKRNGQYFPLTEVGHFTLQSAAKLVSPFNVRRMLEMRCNCSDKRLKEKILQAFEEADEGDLVCFVGDMTNECDGKITPKLNVSGGIIRDPFNDEILSAISDPKKDHPERYLIWNNERDLWWKPSKYGYTGNVLMAGTYSLQQANEILKDANIHSEEEIKKSLDEVKKLKKEELIGRGW